MEAHNAHPLVGGPPACTHDIAHAHLSAIYTTVATGNDVLHLRG